VVETGGDQHIPAIAAAPHGSALILLISWAYIKLLGAEGLTKAAKTALLNANYLADQLADHYDIVFRGPNDRVAHEFILDLRPFRKELDINEQDVAKRLMDYGFHAPTMSWPVVGTLMVEPTESESKAELDRLVTAFKGIRSEIEAVENGTWTADESTLKQAPHTAEMVTADTWDHPYSRETAAYPVESVRTHKFWPTVRRVNDAYEADAEDELEAALQA
jgi:glycine dehydrogenase